ncbi:hypothetical protein FZC83_02095 [Rossellomorea marisflavi]|uniref:DUF6440 domain-containing protein n=1 Tax=Rossellomorea marisflavi TaxID=189381 RepID=A0A5D4RYH4_9BACI|nr:DUF6440 family protein [Rossellomorea marisflavi]TYS56387.1 hypothetical protein FZC83_02095 [Rossellomorea marisflavi]
MRKLFLIASCSLFLGACGQVQANQKERFSSHNHMLSVSKDSETGCKYLILEWDKRGGITPLLKSDGTPDCN